MNRRFSRRPGRDRGLPGAGRRSGSGLRRSAGPPPEGPALRRSGAGGRRRGEARTPPVAGTRATALCFGVLLGAFLLFLLLSGCGETPAAPAVSLSPAAETEVPARVKTGSMELEYANQFSVDRYSDGSSLITIGGTDRFLVLPAEAAVPAEETDVPLIRQPAGQIYLAASSAADLFVKLDALDSVRFTSTTLANWGLPAVREALEAETLVYAGKYSAPDFELLLSEGCSLAVESTMIYHSPEIKEKLEDLGIPVIVERSSYEPHPLGRVEWIRLYGLLTGREAEAERFFRAQVQSLTQLEPLPAAEQTVAYFHISTAGSAVVRKPGDYVSRMIELAGGRYVFDDLPGAEDNALSTMNMQLESFYAGARDADVLIYNGTIDAELETVNQLLEKSSVLADFKAVRAGNVWCAERDLFQNSAAAADIITELNAILAGTGEDLRFFHRLR